MVRKNCESEQNKQYSLLCMQSGHSEKEEGKIFSVVSSKVKSLANKFYNLAYKLGLKTLKTGCSASHYINKIVFCNVNKGSKLFKLKIRRGLKAVRLNLATVKNEVKAPFVKAYSQYGNIKAEYKKQREDGFLQSLNFLRSILVSGIKNNKKVILNFMNYIYPLCGLAIFITTINILSGFKYGLSIECLGKHIGYVENECVLLDASKEMNSRINYDKNQEPINCLPQYTLVKLGKNAIYSNKDEVANNLLKASNKMICFATGLYVNDNFIGAVKNGEEIQNLIASILQPYKERYPNDEVCFVDDVKIESGYYLTNSVSNLENISKKITKNVEDRVVYTVQKGDAPSTIALNNSVPYQQIKDLNPGIEQSLKPGEEIVVKNSKPFLSVKVNQTFTRDDEIPYDVETIEDSNISKNFCKITSPGKNGVVRRKYNTTIIDGVMDKTELVNEQTVISPKTQKVLVGTKDTKLMPYKASGEKVKLGITLLSPVYNPKITCGYNGYRGHDGVDYKSATGDIRIFASAEGTVIFAGWRGAYGNCVIIDHGNGIQTLYAHHSKILVKVGDKVEARTQIAVMGSTGRSSGIHCHNGVKVNGVTVNPENYVVPR